MQIYYPKNFKNDTSWNFLWKEFFSEFYADTFTDYPINMYTSVSEVDGSSKCSSDTDDMNIRPTKGQKAFVIDSNVESENKTHSLEKTLQVL